MQTLWYLHLRQWTNTLQGLVRSPKKLIPVALIALWLAIMVFQTALITIIEPPGDSMVTQLWGLPSLQALRAMAFLLLVLVTFSLVQSALNEGLLIFSAAEVDFLFPLPLPRRAVLLGKLARDYAKLLLASAFVMLLTVQMMALFGARPFPLAFLSWGGLLGLLILALNLTHLLNLLVTFHWARWQARRRLIMGVLWGLLSATIGLAVLWPAEAQARLALLVQWINSEVCQTVFAPLAWTADLLLLPTTGWSPAHGWKLLGLWGLAAFALGLLLSRRENIYEPALGISLRYSRIRAAMRTGNLSAVRTEALLHRRTARAGWTFPPLGAGALALWWKNLLLAWRWPVRRLLGGLAIVVLPVLVAEATMKNPDPFFLSLLPGLYLYVGGMAALSLGNLFRSELRQANILKAIPIASWKVLLAQIAPPVFAVSVVALLSAWMAAWRLPVDQRALGTVALNLPAYVLLISLVQVNSVLLYPNFQGDRIQTFLANIVGMLISGLAVTPGLILGGLLFWCKAPVGVIVVIVTGLNLSLAVLALLAAARLYQRLDPTEE